MQILFPIPTPSVATPNPLPRLPAAPSLADNSSHWSSPRGTPPSVHPAPRQRTPRADSHPLPLAAAPRAHFTLLYSAQTCNGETRPAKCTRSSRWNLVPRFCGSCCSNSPKRVSSSNRIASSRGSSSAAPASSITRIHSTKRLDRRNISISHSIGVTAMAAFRVRSRRNRRANLFRGVQLERFQQIFGVSHRVLAPLGMNDEPRATWAADPPPSAPADLYAVALRRIVLGGKKIKMNLLAHSLAEMSQVPMKLKRAGYWFSKGIAVLVAVAVLVFLLLAWLRHPKFSTDNIFVRQPAQASSKWPTSPAAAL